MRSGIRIHGAAPWRRGFPAVALAAVCLLSAFAGEAGAQARPLHGRLFAPIDLGLLEGPDRDLWQLPDEIMDTLGIAEGSVVADIGAGGGWFTVRLARRVGANGIVYAEDIQPQMLEATMRRVTREGLANVRRVMGTPEDPRLPAAAIDAALIVDTYSEFDNPGALLRNIATSLKPNGRIGVVDFKRDGLGPGPALEDRVDPDEIVRDAEAAGLRLVRRETFLPYQFLLVFSRPQPGVR
ncbi:MAG: methyltransferase domain-containing protein [Vicinamibacterales bacterium]